MEHIHESPSVGNGGVLTALTASTGAAVGTGASDDVAGGGSTRARDTERGRALAGARAPAVRFYGEA